MQPNFTKNFLNKIDEYENNLALIWRQQKITFFELKQNVLLFANYLEGIQKKFGFHCARFENPLKIAVFSKNSNKFLYLILASQLIGATIIPMNPSYKKYEIEKYLNECQPNLIFVSDDFEISKIEKRVEIIRISDILMKNENLEKNILEKQSENGQIVFFSSGTTGTPKPFNYNQRILNAQLKQITEIDKDENCFSPKKFEKSYGCLPYFHAGGLMTVFSMLFIGCTILINEKWNENEFLSNIDFYKISIIFIVPPVLKFLAHHPMIENYELKSLKTIYVGAASSDPNDFQLVSKRMPNLENLIQLYGITECGALLCSTQKGISSGKTVGKPFPMIRISLDPNQQILILSPTGQVENQFMETGDIGKINEINGELEIVGRSKEMIKIRGWQVNPNEIEQLIRTIEQVSDCAVYQIQNPDNSSQLIAKVVGSPSTRQIILDKVKNCLASFKQLDDVIFVENLPRNASGKLMRKLL